MVAKALRHLFNISIGMPFVHKMYGRIGLCATHMRSMASKRIWSGAESRKSKRQRELLRSVEAIESITTFFARTAYSAVSISEGSLVLRYLTVTVKIGCTIPITSCTCECSFSTLRRLRNWMRSSMSCSRLSSLALMNIHYNHEVNLDRAVEIFLFNIHPRKIDLSNLMFT